MLTIAVILFQSTAGQCQVDVLRELFLQAGTEEGIRNFNQYASTLSDKQPLIRAYKGVAFAMNAQLAAGVREKFDWFNRGRDLIESAVQDDPTHPEIAFLRFSVQSEVPAILNYRNNLSNDANKVVVGLRLKKLDIHSPFWQKSIQFMIRSGKLNQLQESEFKRHLL